MCSGHLVRPFVCRRTTIWWKSWYPLRFRAVQSESGYVGDFGWQQADTGVDSAKISLRLSQLHPGEEGYDASYAKVSFKNEKIDWSRCSHTDLIINMLKKEAKR